MNHLTVTNMHCQGISTRYLGATNYRGSRVVAKAQAGRVIVSWDDAIGTDENHDAAAFALAAKFGWKGPLVGGGSPDGKGNVYVFASR